MIEKINNDKIEKKLLFQLEPADIASLSFLQMRPVWDVFIVPMRPALASGLCRSVTFDKQPAVSQIFKNNQNLQTKSIM